MRLSTSFGFALFLLLLPEKHRVFLLICLFLLITKVFIKFKRILFGKNIRLCAFKSFSRANQLILMNVKIFLVSGHGFSMSTRNFIGSGQSTAYPLLDNRWIACSAITQVSCVFNMCGASVHTRLYGSTAGCRSIQKTCTL